MCHLLSAPDIWADIVAVRERAPLVHSITNFVVTGFNANVLLAAGASPVMAHAHEEVMEMAGIAQALVLNIGTLEPYWIESMRLALKTAAHRGIPTVLDPVGAGATTYRNASVALLLDTAAPSVVRGNASEIMSVTGLNGHTKGVDSNHGADSDEALRGAHALVERTQGVVCISGATDYILAQQRLAQLHNGHVWMTRITGLGCSASALVGAFCSVQPDAWRATVSAMALLGVAGEVAAQKAQARGQGLGSMQALLLDELQLLDLDTFAAHLKLELKTC